VKFFHSLAAMLASIESAGKNKCRHLAEGRLCNGGVACLSFVIPGRA
jgi:hypothetical protein